MSEPQVSDRLRQTVRRELPEIAEIGDTGLGDKVVEAWATSLAQEGFDGIGEIQGAGGPNHMVLKQGTQVDHLRGVALLALRMADQLVELQPDLAVNRDVVIAGALVHDVGKPFEFKAESQARWEQNPGRSGWPPARHSVHGWHICRSVGLPDEVAHIAVGHSREGEIIIRSLECTIVTHADHAYWQILQAGGLLADEDPDRRPIGTGRQP